MKIKRKIILSVLLIPLIIILLGIIVLKYGGYFFIKESEKELIVSEVKSAPNLPDRFYELYEITYSLNLEGHNHIKIVINKIINSKNRLNCECSNAIYFMTHYYGIKKVLISNYLDNFLSQKECLNYNAGSIDLLLDKKGVWNASIHYFNTPLENLNDTEYVKLILMMENPSLYNPKRRMKELNEKTEEILKNLK